MMREVREGGEKFFGHAVRQNVACRANRVLSLDGASEPKVPLPTGVTSATRVPELEREI